MSQQDKISVTVITGFLGAGKTTFINRILKTNPETQFALVENEFGDVSIDTQLIKGVDATQLFELKDGCICCTITNEYEGILKELAERFPQVEHLLIETTGIADPVSVIRPFFRDDELNALFNYNGCVCMVDALNFDNQPDKEIALKQLAVADEVVVTKSEQLADTQKTGFKKKIEEINSHSSIQFAENRATENFRLNSHASEIKFHDPESAGHAHSKINTKTIRFSQLLDKGEFMRRLAYNLDINKSIVYRVKGILCFENEPYQYILQGVGGSFELNEGERLVTNTESVLVLIGKFEDLQIDLA
jgi:G3E family GTPase